MKPNEKTLRPSAAAAVLALLVGCGGGGGGGDGSPPLTYTGNTNAAAISATNAGALSSSAATGGSDLPTSSLASSGDTEASDGFFGVGQRIARAVRVSLTQQSGASPLTSVPIDETVNCDAGGTIRVVGDVSQAGTGTVQAIYTNCGNLEGEIFSGAATLRIDQVANILGDLVPTDFTVIFSPLAVRGTKNIDLAGSVRFQIDIPFNTETVTENVVARNNATGRMAKWENLRTVIVYNNISAPSSYTASVSGRVYDSVHGFVDIVTPVALVFATMAQEHPNGGELLLTGANGTLLITALSATQVQLAVDIGNNGSVEFQALLTWTGLPGQQGADIGDTDGDGMHNSWETAFGLNPAVDDAAGDKDGDGQTNLAEYLAGTTP